MLAQILSQGPNEPDSFLEVSGYIIKDVIYNLEALTPGYYLRNTPRIFYRETLASLLVLSVGDVYSNLFPL